MNILSALRGLAPVLLAAALAPACAAGGVHTSGPAGADGGTSLEATYPDGADGGAPSAPPSDCSELPRSQAASQPCCRAYGVDACGALLFCAAFDGRRQPTCYPERSRLDGAECAADAQCVSGSCNVDKKACRSSRGTKCAVDVGCASDQDQGTVACIKGTCTFTEGRPGDPCASPADCVNGTCSAESKCQGGDGATCRTPNDCAEGFCCNSSASAGTCQDCRGAAGAACGMFAYPCRPGLVCCSFSGSGSYCETKC